MIDKPYFVILNDLNDGSVMPLMENEYELAMFETELIARESALKNGIGDAYGFEIFELGNGNGFG